MKKQRSAGKIRILQEVPKRRATYALVPFGIFCNSEIAQAKPCSIVEFWDEWRHAAFKLMRSCTVPVDSPVFTFMLRSLYGERMTTAQIMRRWETMCIREGYGRDGFSRTEVLLIEIKEITD